MPRWIGAKRWLFWPEYEIKVQFFVMRLNYSRVRFVKAYPFQKQEAFLEAHEFGFHFNGGVPHRITYDNLKTAVFKILEGHNRQEQEAFKAFRSYYLFDSRYCTPAQGHEKGGVESDVGYAQRNFFSPIPRVNSYEELESTLVGMLPERCRPAYPRARSASCRAVEIGQTTFTAFTQAGLPNLCHPASESQSIQPGGL